MKIVLVHNTYREPGGEDVVFESEKRLLERNGHRVIPYVRSNSELRDASVVDRIAVFPQMLWSLNSRRDFEAILEKERPDIVHIHNTFMVISPSIYSPCVKGGIPIVQTLHNFRLLCPAGNFFRHGIICRECVDHDLLRSIRHGCYRESRSATAAVALMLSFHRVLDTYRKFVSRFITLTEFAKQEFISAGFPSDRFIVKPNFTYPDPEERTAAGDYAIFAGRLMENKGTRVLLNAWKKLRQQYPLQVVGDGPDREMLEREARELKLSGVTFHGRISRDQVIAAMKGARFVVVPSTLFEGFPMCITESFACGTPVLCSKLGGLAEIVQDHKTGLHFRPGDPDDLAQKVEWAWNHPTELTQMGREARRKYETAYTAEKNYSLLMDVYEQALMPVTQRASLNEFRRPEKSASTIEGSLSVPPVVARSLDTDTLEAD